MTMKKRQFAKGVMVGAVSAVMAAVGCSQYPADLAGPQSLTTNSLSAPTSLGAGGEAASAIDEEDDGFSYSQGAPVFSTAAVEDGAAGYWTWVYPDDCVKYRVLNRTVQFANSSSCEDRMTKVWVPAPAPNRGTTPKPSPSPSPSPVASPQLPSGARPSVKPQGEGIFWFRVTHYFSPNGDKIKDTARIDVVATPDIGHWTLTIEGVPGTMLQGTGSRLNVDWNGMNGASLLPNAKYLLKLQAGGAPTQTAEIVLDTVAPPFDAYFDGSKAEDDKLLTPIEALNPKVELKFNNEISGVSSKNSVQAVFSRRPDNQVPKIYQENTRLDWEKNKSSGVYTYAMPFSSDGILYPGTQRLTIKVGDRAGNVAEREIEFPIGGRTSETFSGGIGPFDPRPAYRLAYIEPEQEELKREFQDKLRSLRERYPSPAYRIETFEPNVLTGFVVTKPFAPTQATKVATEVAARNAGLVFSPALPIFAVVASATSAVVLWIYTDQEMSKLSEVVKHQQEIHAKIDIGRVGDKDFGKVETNHDTWHHMYTESGHFEVSNTDLLACLYKLKQRQERDLEVWSNPDSSTKPGVSKTPGSVSFDHLLLTKLRGHVFFTVIHNKPSSENNFVRTSYIPTWSSGYSPTAMWKYIARKVAEWHRLYPDSKNEFERIQAKKYFEHQLLDLKLSGGVIKSDIPGKTASHKFNDANPFNAPQLEFTDWIYGDIQSEPLKTYYISKTKRQAVARDDRGL